MNLDPRTRSWLLAAFVLGVVLAPVIGSSAPVAEATPWIVMFDELPADVVERLRSEGATHVALYPAIDAAALVAPAHARGAIASWPGVRALYPETDFTPAMFQAKSATGADRVQAGDAPLNHAYNGSGVTVALIDTGIDTSHPDLADRVATNLNFEPSGVLDAITDGGYSRTVAESPFGIDELQHGTLTGGILAGTGVAARSADMRGVAPAATLVNLKVIGQATHEVPDAIIAESSVLAAYQWLLDHRDDPRFPGGIRIASNSWGFSDEGFEPPAITAILREAIDQGVVVVFAASNDGPEQDTVRFPARLPWLITVGATCKPGTYAGGYCSDGPGSVAEFSSRGPMVDVVAPGVEIWGPFAKTGYEMEAGMALGPRPAWFPPGPGRPLPDASPSTVPILAPPAPGADDPLDEASNRFWYGFASGTSLAAPQVAGIVALMLQANPDLTHTEIETILRDTAVDVDAAGFDTATGFGLVDAVRAVDAAEESQ